MVNYKISYEIIANDKASPALGNLNRELDGMGRVAAPGATGGLNMLKGGIAAVGAVAGAVALREVYDLSYELSELGSAAKANEARLIELAGGADAAASTMAMLRNTTNGIVDDMTLMGGANELMRTGIAANAAEVDRLIEMAVALRKPTDSAADAIDNFTAMLLNQSVARLDSFGISSGQVREEIDGLLASGRALNREEAFTMAVMEIGAESMEALGSASGLAATEVDTLKANFANLKREAGEAFNTIFEGAAGLANTAFEVRAGNAAEGELRAQAEAQAEAIFGAYVETYGTPQHVDQVREVIVQTQLDALRGAERDLESIMMSQGFENAVQNPELYGEAFSALLTAINYDPVLGAAVAIADERERERRVVGDMLTANAELQAIERQKAEAAEAHLDAVNRAADAYLDQLDAQRQNTAEYQRQQELLNNMATIGLDAALGAGGGPDSQFLADLLGEAGLAGTRAGETALGQRNDLTTQIDDQIAPLLAMIGEDVSSEAAVAAGVRFRDTFFAEIAAGADEATAFDAAAAAIGYKMGEGTGREFTVGMGDTVSGLSLETGLSQEEIMKAAGIDDPRLLQAGTYGTAGGAGLISLMTAPEAGPGNLPEGAGPMAEPLTALEERRGIMADISANMTMMAEASAPDLGPDSTGLAASEVAALSIMDVLDKIGANPVHVRIVYDVETRGMLPPGGGDVLPTARNIGEG